MTRKCVGAAVSPYASREAVGELSIHDGRQDSAQHSGAQPNRRTSKGTNEDSHTAHRDEEQGSRPPSGREGRPMQAAGQVTKTRGSLF